MTLYDKNKIILVIFQTAAEIVISNISDFLPIPKWVDFLIKFSIDFPKALQSKLGNQVSKKEIIATISSLNKAEVKEIIDTVLESDDNKKRVENLTPQQFDLVKKRLSSLPNEIENILTNIEIQTRIEISQQEHYRKVKKKDEYLALKEELNDLIRYENIKEAHKISVRLLKLNPFDFEVSKTEGRLYRILQQHDEGSRKAKKVVVASLLAVAIMVFCCVSIFIYTDPKSIYFFGLILTPTFLMFTIVIAATLLWGHFPYIIRRIFGLILLALFLITIGGVMLLYLFSN